jgi:hypothetical protein
MVKITPEMAKLQMDGEILRLEAHIIFLTSLLEAGTIPIHLKYSDICAQRGDAMAALNTLKASLDAGGGVLLPELEPETGTGGEGAQIDEGKA